MLAVKYRNRIPVVAVDGKWVVLTERSLIASRKQEKPPNFGISATTSHGTKGSRSRKTTGKSNSATEKKKWRDEESSEEEWTKEINTLLVSTRSGGNMDTDTDEEAKPHTVHTKNDELQKSPAQQTATDGEATNERSNNVTMTDMTTKGTDEQAYFDVE